MFFVLSFSFPFTESPPIPSLTLSRHGPTKANPIDQSGSSLLFSIKPGLTVPSHLMKLTPMGGPPSFFVFQLDCPFFLFAFRRRFFILSSPPRLISLWLSFTNACRNQPSPITFPEDDLSPCKRGGPCSSPVFLFLPSLLKNHWVVIIAFSPPPILPSPPPRHAFPLFFLF